MRTAIESNSGASPIAVDVEPRHQERGGFLTDEGLQNLFGCQICQMETQSSYRRPVLRATPVLAFAFSRMPGRASWSKL